jgi:extracellular factor (EF) 3-hydroxypalmitic acid methyl ester biosynthesis protein
MPIKSLRFLTENDCQRLLDKAERRVFRRGQALFRENDAAPGFWVLNKGLVRVERNYQGHGLAVARYGPGDLIGEVAFLKDSAARGTIVAEEDAEADVIRGEHLKDLLASDSGFAARFYHSLALCLGDRLLQILPGLQLPDALGGARRQALRTGQLSAKQIPEELREGMEGFRAALNTSAGRLQGKQIDVTAVQRDVSAACAALVALLARFTTPAEIEKIAIADLATVRDKGDLLRGIGGFVFRQSFPLFLQSATIAQAYEQETGRMENRDLLERIEDNEAAGDGKLGQLIDRWFLDGPLCRARRSSLREATAFLQEVAADVGRPEPVRLTSLAAGTATEVFHLLAATARPLYVTCIDNNRDALVYNTERAKDLELAERITFLQADLLATVQADLLAAEQGRGSGSLGMQRAIYGLGVCDCLKDEQVLALLKWAHQHLEAGGQLLLTQRDAASPDRPFTEHILDWPITYRTQEQFRTLVAASAFGGGWDIRSTEAGASFSARCKKR